MKLVILLSLLYTLGHGSIKQLWPFDRKTCMSEVLYSSYQNPQGCNHTFGSQPNGFLFNCIVLDGLSYIDVPVDFTAFTKEHYSIHGFFYFTQVNGVLFDYYSDDGKRQVKLWANNGQLVLYSKYMNFEQPFYGGTLLVVSTWYFIAMSVDTFGTVRAYINGTLESSGTVLPRSGFEVPGNLRIGASFDGSGNRFSGRVTCVGTSWATFNPDMVNITSFCKETPWMHDCFVLLGNVPIYSGTINKTITGKTCQRWDANFPQKNIMQMSADHANYCRTPDEFHTLWCYTIDPATRYEECKVPHCQPANRKTNNGMQFTKVTNLERVPKVISSEHRKTIIQCAYACMSDERCYYFKFDENDKVCIIFSREESVTADPSVLLYKLSV